MVNCFLDPLEEALDVLMVSQPEDHVVSKVLVPALTQRLMRSITLANKVFRLEPVIFARATIRMALGPLIRDSRQSPSYGLMNCSAVKALVREDHLLQGQVLPGGIGNCVGTRQSEGDAWRVHQVPFYASLVWLIMAL